MNPLTASIRDLQSALRSGSVCSVDIVEAHISQILQVNGVVNGLVANRFSEARKEAQFADHQLKNSPNTVGPLTGIPCTIKEFLGVNGLPQTGGVLWRKDEKATKDATVVARLRSAGAIILGVTNVPEGGLWLETYNAIYGRTNNPWDSKRTSGGSSGGEGALVATGATPFGIGSDVGGSIRIPAAFCGTVGHKPTGGLVPNTGHYPENALTQKGGRYLTVGPLARTVDDAWKVLKIIAGPDGIDTSSCHYPMGSPNDVNIEQMKVLVVAQNGRSRTRADVKHAVEEAANSLRARGAQLIEFDSRSFKRGFEIWSAMLGAETRIPYGAILGRDKPLNPFVEVGRMLAGRGRHTFAANFMVLADNLAKTFPSWLEKYVEVGLELRAELEETLGTNGVILHPPYNRPAPAHWDAFRTPFAPAYTALFNVLEFPVTQVPCGFSQEGLPLGVQVIGARGQDHRTIAAAEVIESASGGWKQAPVDQNNAKNGFYASLRDG